MSVNQVEESLAERKSDPWSAGIASEGWREGTFVHSTTTIWYRFEFVNKGKNNNAENFISTDVVLKILRRICL